MDVSTVVSITSPDMVESVGDMLELMLSCYNIPPKMLAAELRCSVDAIYSAAKGVRSLPIKARHKLASKNIMASAMVALEATGYTRLFGYQKVDRHVQSMIVRLRVKDRKTDKLLDALPELLVDKNTREDLTPEEIQQLHATVINLTDLANSHINLIMELEVKYGLSVAPYLQGKEKIAH